MDIEKAFDSLNHCCLLAVLEKFAFGTSFIDLTEASLNKLESCGKTSQCFQLKRTLFLHISLF